MRGEPFKSFPKPGKGSHRVAKIKNTLNREAEEVAAKREAKARDHGRCRWPHERGEKGLCRRMRVEVAHCLSKSLGGANLPENLITLDAGIHQGSVSLHSGDLRVKFLTPDKADGPCAFEAKKGGRWIEIGRESSVGVLESR
jgi:hypothetical protein